MGVDIASTRKFNIIVKDISIPSADQRNLTYISKHSENISTGVETRGKHVKYGLPCANNLSI